MAHNV